jgi:hypothetical protein
LSLANRANCETELGDYVLDKMTGDHIPTLHALEQRFEKKDFAIPDIDVVVVSGKDYNILLSASTSGEVR